jgi:RNA 3'-terminal phosphate cyclase
VRAQRVLNQLTLIPRAQRHLHRSIGRELADAAHVSSTTPTKHVGGVGITMLLRVLTTTGLTLAASALIDSRELKSKGEDRAVSLARDAAAHLAAAVESGACVDEHLADRAYRVRARDASAHAASRPPSRADCLHGARL